MYYSNPFSKYLWVSHLWGFLPVWLRSATGSRRLGSNRQDKRVGRGTERVEAESARKGASGSAPPLVGGSREGATDQPDEEMDPTGPSNWCAVRKKRAGSRQRSPLPSPMNRAEAVEPLSGAQFFPIGSDEGSEKLSTPLRRVAATMRNPLASMSRSLSVPRNRPITDRNVIADLKSEQRAI